MHITALCDFHPFELALAGDTLWVVRGPGRGDRSELSIEGIELESGARIGPTTMDTQLIQTLGAPISHRRWSELYGSVRYLWGLNWQGDHPWLTIQIIRTGTRSVRKRYHLRLETALDHLGLRQS